ncbi:short chain dehydrogenase [Mycolicibacterium duvalii]|uniref:Short chain dehydrogenase n=1 Tax=Mycolicibacterium duvalii TaxID=39688 RepID=A0A7I7K1T3_9MYCO|nr:SDR family oxidoreductase [Mycolicibacterium duvalii]MCV7370344.1 SDR family oxidoreductase [Mycolicibacterium duvalii]PEG36543.1 short chain dehydrogenase [Mycolicibacterium duvalii]BBX18110.1 short chain dehydrogenase [Mycolicibacterium duvalii]
MLASPQRIILVTGASSGVGADVAAQVADPDTHVVVHHRDDARRAETVARTIRDAGGQASTITADLDDEFDVTAMIHTLGARFGRLDGLILNASGDQRRLARLAMPLMRRGARIVFVTSHQAHFYPHKAVPKGYAGIAASQRAGETALYTMRYDFAHAGISFTVVSAEITGHTDVASAVVTAATTAHPSGIVYVGRAASLLTA